MPSVREQFAAAAKARDARNTAPAQASAFRSCTLRGQEKIGERKCSDCPRAALLTVYACPKHPEGVTYKDPEGEVHTLSKEGLRPAPGPSSCG